MSVIRLKRLQNDEPPEALVVYYKRRKIEDSTSVGPLESGEQVFKFVGTVTHKNDESLREIANIISRQKTSAKTRKFEGVQKSKAQTKERSKKARYKLMNTVRGLSSDSDKEKGECSSHEDTLNKFDLYDAENDANTKDISTKEDGITCNGDSMSVVSMSDFVYDLYYIDEKTTDEDGWGSIKIEGYMYQETVGSENDDEDKYYDEDDSNSENNWRNDYPDESDDQSTGEDDDYDLCIRKMAGCLIDHNYDHPANSSDSDKSIDEEDQKRYGRSYAIYKAKVKRNDELE